MRAVAALAALVSLVTTSGCSVFFDPNDHFGPGADGGGRDGGGRDGGLGVDGPAPVDGGPVVFCEGVTPASDPPTPGPEPTWGPSLFAGHTQVTPSELQLRRREGPVAPLADLDLVLVDEDPITRFVTLFSVGETGTGAAATAFVVSQPFDASGLMPSPPATSLEPEGVTSARWVAARRSGDATVAMIVAGDPAPDFAGAWVSVLDTSSNAVLFELPLSGLPAVWGRVGVSGSGSRSEPTTFYYVEPPGAPMKPCAPPPAVHALELDELGTKLYNSFGSPHLARPGGDPLAEPVELSGSDGAVSVISLPDGDTLIWAREAAAPASFEATDRTGAAALTQLREGHYAIAFPFLAGGRLLKLYCEVTPEVRCQVRADGDTFSAEPVSRVALGSTPDGTIVLAFAGRSLAGDEVISVSLREPGDVSAVIAQAEISIAGPVLDLAVDVMYPSVGVAWTIGSSPADLTAEELWVAGLRFSTP